MGFLVQYYIYVLLSYLNFNDISKPPSLALLFYSFSLGITHISLTGSSFPPKSSFANQWIQSVPGQCKLGDYFNLALSRLHRLFCRLPRSWQSQRKRECWDSLLLLPVSTKRCQNSIPLHSPGKKPSSQLFTEGWKNYLENTTQANKIFILFQCYLLAKLSSESMRWFSNWLLTEKECVSCWMTVLASCNKSWYGANCRQMQ